MKLAEVLLGTYRPPARQRRLKVLADFQGDALPILVCMLYLYYAQKGSN